MLKIVLFLSFSVFVCGGLLGGFQDVDVKDKNVLAAANHAAEAVSNSFSSKFHHKLVAVLKAKQQVVAGMNYQMDVVLGITDCPKDRVVYEHIDVCWIEDFNVSTFKKCSVRVFEDLKGNHKLISSGCILISQKELESLGISVYH